MIGSILRYQTKLPIFPARSRLAVCRQHRGRAQNPRALVLTKNICQRSLDGLSYKNCYWGTNLLDSEFVVPATLVIPGLTRNPLKLFLLSTY